ncbi:para-nitrobenzyl esterase [Streptoalloteichus tenebrarius]|uniref:Carboxylic ester hydrolase n=1 Tax=Streptoalloteichus tenebrarius (strain ATCC 17920 / DSM 40477 / JCM 4838 / CBS 697.72 / NBRC 16177 / NCIMB 11028 / NRRL B-12390 / A12253. 1 / ISP 5477) TaxID=1933 RepID=A0ABT1HUB7_STRSD|nr:carboxylesterase family protein [Streptoalloteichus tenebrarius]MCP2259086.1 para-nitrobenzyl esterase [Streptoalloteichus tenebrarius]
MPRDCLVRTRHGTVRGSTSAGVHRFLGVSYAMPPFGSRRFQPPRRPEPWSGVRDALAFGPTPPQIPMSPPFDAFSPLVDGEDCLNLNIWSRDLGSSARQPVMVWIPGGGWDNGGNIIYDGSRFARDGVVCVAINYRLGADGFLYLDDGLANLGLLDQVAALEWVRDNIAAFGGDPDNVTVAGESSGAMSVGALLSLRRARGLFHRAVLESGAGNQSFPPETGRRISHDLAFRLGVAPTREAIASVPVPRLLSAQAEVAKDYAARPDARLWGGEPAARVTLWQPVRDGDVLPSRPIDQFLSGAGADIPVLIGQNTEEGRLSLVPFGLLDRITEVDLATAMTQYGLPAPQALAVYRETYPGAGPGDLLALLQGDWYYRAPAIRLAEARAAHAGSTHMYEFAWRSPAFDGLLGACHFLEVPFVFDLVDTPTMRALTGPNPPRQLATTVHNAWVAFMTSGDPGWPCYDPRRRATMRFDIASRVVNDPWPAVRELWAEAGHPR